MSNFTNDSNALLTPQVGHGISKKYNIGHPMPSAVISKVKTIIIEKYRICVFAVCFIKSKHSHQIIEIEDCLLQSEKAKIIIQLFKEYMIENKISAYNEITHKGIVKHIVLREAGDDFILTVVVTDDKFNKFLPLIEKLKQHFSSFGLFATD